MTGAILTLAGDPGRPMAGSSGIAVVGAWPAEDVAGVRIVARGASA